MTGQTTRKLTISVAVLALMAFGGLAACGDDDGGGSAEAYCDLSAELQDVSDPSDEQLDEIVDAAPDEISEEAQILADAIREGDPTAFEDEEVVEAGTAIQEFDAENCAGDST